jgi:hypothetical protein
VNLPGDLELHFALQHGDQFVRRVPEVFTAGQTGPSRGHS